MENIRSLKAARKLLRHLQSEQRKEYRRKANGYNSLANKSKTLPSDFKYNPSITLQDVIDGVCDQIDAPHVQSTKRRGRIQKELDIVAVSDEVRSAWHQKITPLVRIDDEVIEKLRSDVINKRVPSRESDIYREAKLDALARAWVTSWLCAKQELIMRGEA